MLHMTVTLKTGRCRALRDISHRDTLKAGLQEVRVCVRVCVRECVCLC